MVLSGDGADKKVKFAGAAVFVAAAYIVAGKIGLLFAFVQANATAVWAPTGIAIAALLFLGYRLWPAVFIGAFIVNITTAGTGLPSALGIATGNTLEALVAVYLVNRFANGIRAFDRPVDVIKFSFLAGVVATAVSATFGVTTLLLQGMANWGSSFGIWITWWLGDMGGAVIVAPFIVLWLLDHRIRWNKEKALEVLFLMLVLAAFALLVGKFGFIFVFMSPIFIWVAFRFDRRTMAATVLIVTEAYVWLTLTNPQSAGHGAVVNQTLILLQAFMVTTFVAMMALATALAEQKEAEKHLLAYGERVSREKASDEAILSSIGDGLLVTDRAGKIVMINPQAEKMFGWEAPEVIGRPLTEVVPIQDMRGDIVPAHERPVDVALSTGKATSTSGVVTYFYARKNGSKFPVAITATPILIDGEIVGAIDLIKDITLEKELDREKGEFISIAAHQLRTPLSSMKWLIELLLESKITDAQRKKLIDVSASNERLINVVRNLLDVTKMENGKIKVAPELLDLKDVIANTIKLCERDAAEKKMKFRYAPAGMKYNALTDRTLFTEALKNILDNAITYAPQGSPIDVDIKERDGGYVVSASNEGPAVPETDRPNLFKRFYRGIEASRLRPSGSGLGLYIAKMNIEALGGSILLDSPTHGTTGVTFSIRIPVQYPNIAA